MASIDIIEVVNKNIVKNFNDILNEDTDFFNAIKEKVDKAIKLLKRIIDDESFNAWTEQYQLTYDYNKSVAFKDPNTGKIRRIRRKRSVATTLKNIIELEKILEQIRYDLTKETTYVSIGFYDNTGKAKDAIISKMELIDNKRLLTTGNKKWGTWQRIYVSLKELKRQVKAKKQIIQIEDRMTDFFEFVKGKKESRIGNKAKIKLGDADAFEVYSVYKNSIIQTTWESYRLGEKHLGGDTWGNYLKARNSKHDSTANYKGGDAGSNVESKFQTNPFTSSTTIGGALFSLRTQMAQLSVLREIFNKKDMSKEETANSVFQAYKLYYSNEDVQLLKDYVEKNLLNYINTNINVTKK